MARTLELTLACVLALMGGVYVLRSSRAEQSRHQAELAAAVARRASLSEALLEARAALENERRWQGDERANLTRALQQRRRRRRIPPSPYQPKPFVPVATAPVAPAPSPPLTQLKDFPCALRDFKVAKVTKTCELLCKEATCARALKHCERLVECDAVVVDGQEIKAGHNRDLSKATVRLLRDDATRAAQDTSRRLLETSKWWGSALKQQTKPRTYIVVSSGGCGSKDMRGRARRPPLRGARPSTTSSRRWTGRNSYLVIEFYTAGIFATGGHNHRNREPGFVPDSVRRAEPRAEGHVGQVVRAARWSAWLGGAAPRRRVDERAESREFGRRRLDRRLRKSFRRTRLDRRLRVAVRRVDNDRRGRRDGAAQRWNTVADRGG